MPLTSSKSSKRLNRPICCRWVTISSASFGPTPGRFANSAAGARLRSTSNRSWVRRPSSMSIVRVRRINHCQVLQPMMQSEQKSNKPTSVCWSNRLKTAESGPTLEKLPSANGWYWEVDSAGRFRVEACPSSSSPRNESFSARLFSVSLAEKVAETEGAQSASSSAFSDLGELLRRLALVSTAITTVHVPLMSSH